MNDIWTSVGAVFFWLMVIVIIAVALINGYQTISEITQDAKLCGKINGEVYKVYDNKTICKTERVVDGKLIEEYIEVENE